MKAVVAEAVGAGEVMAKTLAYGVDSLFMETGRFLAFSRALSFISLVFILAFPFFVSIDVFVFIDASISNVFFS